MESCGEDASCSPLGVTTPAGKDVQRQELYDLATAISETLQFEEAHGMGGNEATQWPPALAATGAGMAHGNMRTRGAARTKRIPKKLQTKRDARYIESNHSDCGSDAIVTDDETTVAMQPAEPSTLDSELSPLHAGFPHPGLDGNEDLVPDVFAWIDRAEQYLASGEPRKIINKRLPDDHPSRQKNREAREARVAQLRKEFKAREHTPKKIEWARPYKPWM